MQPASMTDSYDDERALRSYLETYWSWHLTDFERKYRTIGARMAKAALDPDSDWARRVRAEWERSEPEVRAALAGGLQEFDRGVRDRILGALQEGALAINRCPSCRRVVRTPLARQCLWCGHDWHA